MSRREMENDQYKLAFGVDHTPMGCFFQIYEKAAEGEQPENDEGEVPQISADEHFGCVISNQNTLQRNQRLKPAIEPVELSTGYLRSEETIVDIGMALGFNKQELERKVHELWD